MCILLLPCDLQAQSAGDALLIGVNHYPVGNERDTGIENIMNRAVVLELEDAGLKGVLLQDVPDGFIPELKITGWYLAQKDMLKLEYKLQEGGTGKQFAEIRIDTPITLFLDRIVATAVKDLLKESQDQITQITRHKQEQDKQREEAAGIAGKTESRAGTSEQSEPGRSDTEQTRDSVHQREHLAAEIRASGTYMIGQASESLPYGLLIEGRVSYPVVQGEHLAWRLGGAVGVLQIFPAVDYKADYIKTLVPLGLLTELSLRKKSGPAFKLWWTAGAALRPPYENEIVDKLLAPAFPYTTLGVGAQVPLFSDRLYLATGLSGLGLFSLYEDSATGEETLETTLGVSLDLGIVMRM